MKSLRVTAVALAFAAPILQLPTPDQAPWEITFVEVEETAGLSSLSNAPRGSDEVRVMHRPWSDTGPLSFLRVIREDAQVRAELFMVWRPSYQPLLPVDSSNSRCSPAGPRRICVRRFDLQEQMDWRVLLTPGISICSPRRPVDPGCADCQALWLKTVRGGTYREEYCNPVVSGTLAGHLHELLALEAAAARARW